MSLMTHLSTLEDKKLKLETMIGEESHRPLPDFSLIQTLKKQKLFLKEEIQRLRTGQQSSSAA